MAFQNFSDSGADPLVGAEVSDALGVHPATIHDNVKMSRFLDIVKFMGQFEDRRFIVQKLVSKSGKQDPIDHVWGYISLRKDLAKREGEMSKLKEQLSYYE